ncbi:hypothetical protein PGT21_017219 [Puccinia graminis f. sp. tritici]|uniref:Uncharacterized protein n=1 Tax=Puccinia graminis f. sp. tritici TaxID=56615 RepID=A0A5B0LJT0_PUCGR|nr:hypothetical protein PGT21_017219 [Puccinia graminis f. sp. tritici]
MAAAITTSNNQFSPVFGPVPAVFHPEIQPTNHQLFPSTLSPPVTQFSERFQTSFHPPEVPLGLEIVQPPSLTVDTSPAFVFGFLHSDNYTSSMDEFTPDLY